MSGLKQLRNRVRSIKSTQKITKAMQVVSASKLKKVKEQAFNLNEYSKNLACIMRSYIKNRDYLTLETNDQKFFSNELLNLPHLLILMSSERGLCGGFNSSVVKKLKKHIKSLENDNKEVKILVVGKKGYDGIKSEFDDKIIEYFNINKDNYECVAVAARNLIIEKIEKQEIGACFMYYNRFKNAMTQIATAEQILPIVEDDEFEDSTLDYEYEGADIMHEIIKLYIGGEINYGLLQSKASEEGARMTAMDNATRNANDLIDKLTLQLNRSRQAMITTELTEIISGAEAL